ncbi:DUF2939 domain-containing protein [Parablastomonas sp. CN1-191]|uniref:DUF2939 domain-containing protein n=1 Tax=Parablastomonas sp. CN1-191 TaxID=3400908 RepID=UPI003BF79575
MKARWLILVAAIVLLAAGVFAAAPYRAAHNLQAAAQAGDRDRLDAAVDFPAVRDNLKSDLGAALTRSLASDPQLKDNPFAGIAALIVPAVVDRGVDAYVTPAAIAALAKGQKPAAAAPAAPAPAGGAPARPAPAATAAPRIKAHYDWLSLDRFRVRIENAATPAPGPAFLFERRGLITWKLVRIELPADLLQAPAKARQPL